MIDQPTLAAAMTPLPCAVTAETPSAGAATPMEARGIQLLPMADRRAITGILGARDIATRQPDPRLVRDPQAPAPCVADPATPLADVLTTMAERHIGCAVVTRHERLAGIPAHAAASRAARRGLSAAGGGPLGPRRFPG